jgi:hypothetical protein
MTKFQPATAYTDSIKRPDCPRCSTRMMLARITLARNKPTHDECTFDCPKCGNELTELCERK